MLGTAAQPGIMVLTLRDLYKLIERSAASGGKVYKVTLSYIEVGVGGGAGYIHDTAGTFDVSRHCTGRNDAC